MASTTSTETIPADETSVDVSATPETTGEETKPVFVNVSARFEESVLELLDNSSFRNRERTRSDALRRIVKRYIAEHPEDVAEIKFV